MRCITVVIGLVMALSPSLEGQTFRVSFGRTSSSVEWLGVKLTGPCEGVCAAKAGSNTDRTSLMGAATVRYSPRSWWGAEAGLRIMPKGFDKTTPTFHMAYAEVPVRGILQTGPAAGFFLEGGLVVGMRVTCRRFMDTVAGSHEDGCGRAETAYGRELAPLRRWDASWELGAGGRISLPQGRLVVTIRAQRSFIDIQPEEPLTMQNRVVVFAAGYEWEPIP